MKLHLPKLLLVAVVAAAITTTASALTPETVNGNNYYKVGQGGSMITHDGDITLYDGDKLGAFDGDSLLSNYDGNKTPSNSLLLGSIDKKGLSSLSKAYNLKHNLTINGTAQVALGGQKGSDYMGVLAKSVTINGTGNDTHLESTRLYVNELIINSGTAKLHNSFTSGNGHIGSGILAFDQSTPKQAQITSKLVIGENASLTMGTTGATQNTDHYMNAFGAGFGSVGTYTEYASPMDMIQKGGTMTVYGFSIATSGLEIYQSGGTMFYRDQFDFNGTSENKIMQGYTLDDSGNKQLQAANKNTSLQFGNLNSNGQQFSIEQAGEGSIKFDKVTGGTFNISQIGKGNIVFGSGFDKATVKVSKSTGTLEFNSNVKIESLTKDGGAIKVAEGATLTADSLNWNLVEKQTKDAGSDIEISGSVSLKSGEIKNVTSEDGVVTVTNTGTLTANTVNVNSGSLKMDGNGKLTAGTVNAAGVTMTGEVILSKGAISTEGDTVTNTGTLNAGQIVVNSGVFVNKGVIDALETQQDAALMLLAGETEEYGLVINGGKVENFGTYEKSILVNGGTLTLEDKSKVASVTVDSGTVLVTGDSTLDSLTLNGDSTLNITYGASITLTDQDAFSLSENATIMVTVSKDMLENLDGLEFELFTHDVANLASANIVFTDGDQDTSNDVTDVTISQGGTSGSIKVEIQAIPEPTTATLSLLALCGLAARRRRK